MRRQTPLKTIPAALILLALALPEPGLLADSYRCGRKVVRSGDSSADLIRKCGEPRRKDSGRERLRMDGQMQEVRVQRWYYQRNSRSIERAVLLRDGRIVAIRVNTR
jgi:hypothetical protein